jgi:hypothetical protein
MAVLSDIATEYKRLLLQIPALDPGWASLLAGMLALIAGYLVYRSATLSRTDAQKREKEEDRRRRLNLFLKAEHMAYILMQVAPLVSTAARLSFSALTPEGEDIPGHMLAAELRIPRPKQLDDLWGNLSDFSPDAIYEIRSITQQFDSAEEYLKRTEKVPDGMQSPLVNYYSAIVDSARVLREIMADSELIKTYCVENPDRNYRLYGEPDDGIDA